MWLCLPDRRLHRQRSLCSESAPLLGVYIVGSLVFNGGCVLLMKPARYLAARSIKNDVKADA